jgi:hypothetical protein
MSRDTTVTGHQNVYNFSGITLQQPRQARGSQDWQVLCKPGNHAIKTTRVTPSES